VSAGGGAISGAPGAAHDGAPHDGAQVEPQEADGAQHEAAGAQQVAAGAQQLDWVPQQELLPHELPHELQLDLQQRTLQHFGRQQLPASALAATRLTAATATAANDNSLRVIAIPPEK